jgi:Preprotein translocase subunit SecB
MEKGPKLELQDYPVQLNFLAVRELFIESFVPPSPDYVMSETSVEYLINRAPYEAQRRAIQIGMTAKIGGDEVPNPELVERYRQQGKPLFRLRVHIMGDFRVDEATFPMEKLLRWSSVNAPFILYPFLREQVFALTARCGFRPVILPMVTVPTFKIESAPQAELALAQ